MKLYSSAIIMLAIAGMVISPEYKAIADHDYEMYKSLIGNAEAIGAVYKDPSDVEMPYKFMVHRASGNSLIMGFIYPQEAVAFQQLLKSKQGI